MSAPTPVTQRDVAEACGLHPSTVCLALKNSPSIPVETRRRIQAVAEELGYQPNVAARNLALLRTERKAGARLPIAWINQEPRRDHWRVDAEARRYFESAKRRAEELGYHLEEIWTREPGMTATRVVQILRARGVEGVIFPAHRSFDFALLNPTWSDFALIGFNDHRLGEWIDVVCPDYYANTQLVLRELRQRDFGRIGLVLTPQLDAATNGLIHGCYLRQQVEVAARDRLPVCFAPEQPREASPIVADWVRECRPDAVLCRAGSLVELMRAITMDTAWLQVHGTSDEFDAGVDAGAAEIAAATVECVVEKMRRFERGVRGSTRLHLVKGTWQERSFAAREPVSVVA
jgi:DNA-binding LacI/PurR family transcriptional regulator